MADGEFLEADAVGFKVEGEAIQLDGLPADEVGGVERIEGGDIAEGEMAGDLDEGFRVGAVSVGGAEGGGEASALEVKVGELGEVGMEGIDGEVIEREGGGGPGGEDGGLGLDAEGSRRRPGGGPLEDGWRGVGAVGQVAEGKGHGTQQGGGGGIERGVGMGDGEPLDVEGLQGALPVGEIPDQRIDHLGAEEALDIRGFGGGAAELERTALQADLRDRGGAGGEGGVEAVDVEDGDGGEGEAVGALGQGEVADGEPGLVEGGGQGVGGRTESEGEGEGEAARIQLQRRDGGGVGIVFGEGQLGEFKGALGGGRSDGEGAAGLEAFPGIAVGDEGPRTGRAIATGGEPTGFEEPGCPAGFKRDGGGIVAPLNGGVGDL